MQRDKDKSNLILDELWAQIEPLLPPEIVRSGEDSTHIHDREVMEAILYALRTDSERNSFPGNLAASTTVCIRFQEWRKLGVFQRMWHGGILTYDELRKLIFTE
jgi:transposase